MDSLVRKYIAVSFVILGLAVLIGAFGAHVLKESITAHYLDIFETGNKYHFVHGLGMALVLFILSDKASRNQLIKVAILFITGIILFSGSLYMISIADLVGLPALKILGAVAPIGGITFIVAWCYSAYVLVKG